MFILNLLNLYIFLLSFIWLIYTTLVIIQNVFVQNIFYTVKKLVLFTKKLLSMNTLVLPVSWVEAKGGSTSHIIFILLYVHTRTITAFMAGVRPSSWS